MDDERERGAISQLGDLALGNILSELGVTEALPAQRLGLNGPAPAPGSTLLARDEIYKDQYADEDDDDDDLVAEARRRRKEEEGEGDDSREKAAPSAADRYYRMGLASMAKTNGHARAGDDDYDESGDEDEDAPLAQSQGIKVKVEPAEAGPSQLDLLKQGPAATDVWPDFRPDAILRFTDMFGPRPVKKRKMTGKAARLRVPSEKDLVDTPSTRDAFARPMSLSLSAAYRRPGIVEAAVTETLGGKQRVKEEEDEEWATSLRTASEKTRAYEMLELDEWEERIAWGDDEEDAENAPPPLSISQTYNHDLAAGTWAESIIWEEGAPHRDFTQLTLDLNDPDMMLERAGEDDEPKVVSLVRSNAPAMSARAARAVAELDPLNLSNDRFYEMTKEQRNRIRQTLGQLVVQHARPAVKLQLPFYKTTLTKAEARSFHRPAMQFPANIPLRFSKVRSSKRKKEERGGASSTSRSAAKDPVEALQSTRDLTLKDTSSFVLYEYSEEYPNVMSNIGMGSLIVNYYRKRDAKDEHMPKLDLGEPFVLDMTDESPFMKFGSVHPGQTQPTLYNNLIRAPLFRHKTSPTDFLLIRSTTKTEIRYYLREIKNLFVVGQTYPIVQIPGPHARLVTNMIKTRLYLIAARLLLAYNGRIKIHRIMRYFPDQNELQMRQRLKEFMEYTRQAGAKDQGYWKLRPGAQMPEESELHKLLPPEHICLIEAMQTGQRHLMDAGYTKTAEGADEDADESTMDVEQRLAPWTISKNFLQAAQGKAMLKLHGEGDPTGRGEAFSFLRVSMKEIFFKAGEDVDARLAEQAEEERRSGHKYNVAKQQTVYKSEVERIWQAQKKSLSNPVPPELTREDEERGNASATPGPLQSVNTPKPGGGWARGGRAGSAAPFSRQRSSSVAGTQAGGDDDASQAGLDNRVLRIKRRVNGHWQTEIVREPAVIHAYIKQRQKIEDEAIQTEALVPTGDAALDAARRKRLADELALAKKNQERRLQRKNAKAIAEGKEIPGGLKKLANKTGTKRVCGRCGEVGHMMTNTACPLYEAGAPSKQIESSASSRKVGSGGAGGTKPGVTGGTPGTPSAGPGSAGPSRRPSMMPSGSFGPGPGSGAATPSSMPPTPMPMTPGTPFAFPMGPPAPTGMMTPGAAGGSSAPSPSAAAMGNPAAKLKLKLKKK